MAKQNRFQRQPQPPDRLFQSYNKGLYRLTGEEAEDDVLNMLSAPGGTNANNVETSASDIGSGVVGGTIVNSANSVSTGSSTPSGVNVQMVSGGVDLQNKLDLMNASGGGKIFLSAGTYKAPSNLTGYSGIEIIGEDVSTTIIDFGNASRSFLWSGTNVYTTGTISGVSGFVNVTGSGTAWLSHVTAGQNLFIGTRWYTIAAVTSDTTLILAEAYGDNVSFPSSYRIATVISGVVIQDVTIINSTSTALAFTDTKDLELVRVQLIANNIGITLNNVSRAKIDQIIIAESTSDGSQLTNCGLFNVSAWQAAGNGGNGFTLNNVKTVPFLFSSSTSNAGDGFHCTTVVDSLFKVEASSNGGIGIQFVSGCLDCYVDDSYCRGNAGDGIKLTATSSNNTLGSALTLTGNGGYGIDIAASSDNNNTIVVPYFAGNASGNYLDNGTGTNVVSTTSGFVPSTSLHFGGTGADGALSVSSGTTTIDLLNSPVFIKNYTSISVTGTAVIAFINPAPGGTLIVFRSQGAATWTSSATPSMDLSNLGGQGGIASSVGNSFGTWIYQGTITGGSGGAFGGGTPGGGGGGASMTANGTNGAGSGTNPGAKGLAPAIIPTTTFIQFLTWPSIPGAGGGGGGTSGAAPGVGGIGGGAFYCECAGALNITSAFQSNGANGASTANAGASGGGGGGAGSFSFIYNTLTANSASFTLTGGTHGTGGAGGAPGGDGGNGSSFVYQNFIFT